MYICLKRINSEKIVSYRKMTQLQLFYDWIFVKGSQLSTATITRFTAAALSRKQTLLLLLLVEQIVRRVNL
jgi:hypothetical protein